MKKVKVLGVKVNKSKATKKFNVRDTTFKKCSRLNYGYKYI